MVRLLFLSLLAGVLLAGVVWAVGSTSHTDRTALAAPPSIIVIPLGDVDCSGRTDVVDAALVLQFDAGISSTRCIRRGDIDDNGRVNSGDAVRILFHLAGLSPL